jgi:hypothetical protein
VAEPRPGRHKHVVDDHEVVEYHIDLTVTVSTPELDEARLRKLIADELRKLASAIRQRT